MSEHISFKGDSESSNACKCININKLNSVSEELEGIHKFNKTIEDNILKTGEIGDIKNIRNVEHNNKVRVHYIGIQEGSGKIPSFPMVNLLEPYTDSNNKYHPIHGTVKYDPYFMEMDNLWEYERDSGRKTTFGDNTKNESNTISSFEGISSNVLKVIEFKKSYDKAIKQGKDTFNFEGKQVPINYAKYIIEFLNVNLENI